MDGGWHVMVEETEPGYGSGVALRTPFFVPGGRDRQEACRLAEQVARTHRPRHPSRPQVRQAFRQDDGVWHVHVRGTTRVFWFRVTVVEWLVDG
ncbi:hypothetical protein [Streptomyces sp. NPDC001380]|uniref:hypothetical protein n=1 Tax=Streptomyces sp. NPDC001380 TaxID=3364566 RepID=UPI0036AB187C